MANEIIIPILFAIFCWIGMGFEVIGRNVKELKKLGKSKTLIIIYFLITSPISYWIESKPYKYIGKL